MGTGPIRGGGVRVDGTYVGVTWGRYMFGKRGYVETERAWGVYVGQDVYWEGLYVGRTYMGRRCTWGRDMYREGVYVGTGRTWGRDVHGWKSSLVVVDSQRPFWTPTRPRRQCPTGSSRWFQTGTVVQSGGRNTRVGVVHVHLCVVGVCSYVCEVSGVDDVVCV